MLTDDDIREFRNKLIIARDAVTSALEYDRAVSGLPDFDEDPRDEEIAVYQRAIDALRALLPITDPDPHVD